jgi:hypothetical protein
LNQTATRIRASCLRQSERQGRQKEDDGEHGRGTTQEGRRTAPTKKGLARTAAAAERAREPAPLARLEQDGDGQGDAAQNVDRCDGRA